MTRVPAEAGSNTKNAAENDAASSAGGLKQKRGLNSRLFCACEQSAECVLLFFTDVDRGNTEGKFMEMYVAEAGFGNHVRELLL